MGLKQYFTGKTGKVFWINILLMAAVLIGVPTIGLLALDDFTHHGEKITVPNIVGENSYEAEIILNRSGLTAVVSDSIYQKDSTPGSVISQNPTGGSEVKKGRIIYLTKNMTSEPLVKLPDLAHNSSRREAEAQLKAMGFRLTENKEVENEPKDLVIGIMQGEREIHAGDKVSKEIPLTLMVGAGTKDDTIMIDTLLTEEDVIVDQDINEDFF